MDADIGHKELDWKITLSGVGKCRQVISKLSFFWYLTCFFLLVDFFSDWILLVGSGWYI